MKRLIVNADDLGADKGRNAGIFEAIDSGVVTSVSILPNAPALEDAVHGICSLHSRNVSIGIHLNLSEGWPVSSGLTRLVGADGKFLGKAGAQRLLAACGSEDLQREIKSEIEAQILLLRSFGFPIDHLDGHQHIHVFSAVVLIAAQAADANHIRWVRIPEEAADGFHPFPVSPAVMEEARYFSAFAAAARPIFNAMGVTGTDHFRGLYMKGQLPSSSWTEFLSEIPNGLTEFMVHPGRVGTAHGASSPFSGFSTIEREHELHALTDGRFPAALADSGFELIPFPNTN
jgi:chitin disaccharide deacetylase